MLAKTLIAAYVQKSFAGFEHVDTKKVPNTGRYYLELSKVGEHVTVEVEVVEGSIQEYKFGAKKKK